MNWKEYEKEILKYFEETYPDANISYDQYIKGRYSKVPRQIDILIEGEIAGYELKIIVDCKFFSKKIDVKHVESFCSMVEDVNAHQGILITQVGYSKAAINRAHFGNQQVELDIINFNDLLQFQSFDAIPYTGHFGVFVPAPFGWVNDLNDRINSFATIHQRGITLKEAQKNNEWIYMQFWEKKGSELSIDNLIEAQNINILKIDSKAQFSYNQQVKRKDKQEVKIRIAEIKSYPALEVTGFIDFGENIFFLVLFTPKELLSKNLRKLQHVLKSTLPLDYIQFDNKNAIKQCLESIEQTDSNEEKANKYYQVGKWYLEMDDIKNALKSYIQGIEHYPTHYKLLKTIINQALLNDFKDEAYKYSISLFEIEPQNPTALQDLIDLYFRNDKTSQLIDLFNELCGRYTEDEILGNLYFHFSLVYLNMDEIEMATEHMRIAETLFKKVFAKDHQVFNAINNFKNKNWA